MSHHRSTDNISNFPKRARSSPEALRAIEGDVGFVRSDTGFSRTVSRPPIRPENVNLRLRTNRHSSIILLLLLATSTPMLSQNSEVGRGEGTRITALNLAERIARLKPKAVGLERTFLDLEADVPGFAGLYLDSGSHTPVLRLVTRVGERAGRERVERFLAGRRRTRGTLQVRDAEFSYSDLFETKRQIAYSISDMGLVSVSVRSTTTSSRGRSHRRCCRRSHRAPHSLPWTSATTDQVSAQEHGVAFRRRSNTFSPSEHT